MRVDEQAAEQGSGTENTPIRVRPLETVRATLGAWLDRNLDACDGAAVVDLMIRESRPALGIHALYDAARWVDVLRSIAPAIELMIGAQARGCVPSTREPYLTVQWVDRRFGLPIEVCTYVRCFELADLVRVLEDLGVPREDDRVQSIVGLLVDGAVEEVDSDAFRAAARWAAGASGLATVVLRIGDLAPVRLEEEGAEVVAVGVEWRP